VADFDYGNARLHAMKSRLLPRRTLEGLTEVGSVQGLITALANTAYRETVAAALVRLTGMDCLAAAWRNDLVATLGKARTFYVEAAQALAQLVLLRYDVHNVKTILRGLAGRVPATDIIGSTLPIGELRPTDISELVRVEDWHMALDLLATWQLPLAKSLLELRATPRSRDGHLEPFEMEVALDRWYFDTVLAGAGGTTLREAVAVEADITNMLTALRLIGVPDVAMILREQLGTDDVTRLFVGAGHIPSALLAEAAQQESIPGAVNTLATTTYGGILTDALHAYAASARISVFERALTQRQLLHAAGLLAHDPLGIGVLLGYAALKTNEVANLRAIAQSLMLGEKPDRIRRELVLVD
jgi:V/A-type H+/Na+-transporting ATPase subunit C